MNRRHRAQLRDFERFAIAEDPELDRTLRGGRPSASQRHKAYCMLAGGTALFLASLLAAFPFGALFGLLLAAGGAYFTHTTTSGPGLDFMSFFTVEARPRPRR